MNDANAEPRAVAGECPSREVLSDLALGKLPLDAIDTLGEHIETCPACQGVLETLDDLEDSVVALIKGQAGTLPPDPQLQEQIREAEQIRVVRGEPQQDTPEEPPPGQLGQYEILERIGRGGMGTAYKAIHPRLKRLVAVKVLPNDRLRDPQAIARFQREMEAVGRLDHPNLVRAYDAGEAAGRHFLVIEFFDGLDLARLVRQGGPLSVADACEAVRQAAVGLDYAHRHGLVHRDVKPSNLMLTRDGAVKVLDLGLARLIPETALSPDHPSVGAGLHNLATLYFSQGRYVEAEPLFKRALAIREKALGPDHPAAAGTLENMARLYRKTGREKEAEPLEKRAAAIRAIKR